MASKFSDFYGEAWEMFLKGLVAVSVYAWKETSKLSLY